MLDQFLSFLSSARGIVVIVLFFGGSIFIHELGHFLAAKWRGMRVEKFSIGFGPRVFGWHGKDGVDYRISLLPLGGYVAIPELAEMSMIEGKTLGLPHVRHKEISYTDRVVVSAAGPFFNVLFAFLLALLLWGIKSSSSDGLDSNVIGHVEKTIETERGKGVPGPAFEAGLRPGDRITSVDGTATPTFDKIVQALALGSKRTEDGRAMATLEIERDGEVRKVKVYPQLVSTNPQSGDYLRAIGVSPIANFKIAPQLNMPALKAGAQYGDRWTAISTVRRGDNGEEIRQTQQLYSLSQLSEILMENGSTPVEISYERNGQEGTLVVAPEIIPATSDVATIEFSENGQHRTFSMVATPEDLADDSADAKRDVLRVFYGLPRESAFSEMLVPGTEIDGISYAGGTIQAVKTPQEFFEKFGKEKMGTFSLFVTKPDGDSGNAILPHAVPGLIPPREVPLLGVRLLSQERLVRKTPWAQFRDAFSITLRSLGGLLNPRSDIGISHLNGIFSIGDTYYEISSNLRSVLALTVLININLAILNILPIPVLDGGHILLATIRRLRGRPIHPRIVNGVQMTFMLLLLVLMSYVLVKDFSRFCGSREVAAEAQIQSFGYSPEFLRQSKNPIVSDE